MTKIHASRVHMPQVTDRKPPERAAGPDLAALAAGAPPTAEEMGSRVDLPGEIREKMENSFGADFSNVRLYESQTVADAGAQAVARGSDIAFAPGSLDLTSTAGQALLGHELSHVVSQARGESTGRGFLNDAHLEAQADRQGMLAARGESAYAGPVSPIGASSTAAASGPMQAKKQTTIDAEDEAARAGETLPGLMHPFERSKAKKSWLDKRRERLQQEEAEKQRKASQRQENLALLQQGTEEADPIYKAKNREALGIYNATLQRYAAAHGVDEKTLRGHLNKGDSHKQRFLKNRLAMLETDEERDRMLKDFASGLQDEKNEDRDAIAGHIMDAMNVINGEGAFDFQGLTDANPGNRVMAAANSFNEAALATVMPDMLKHYTSTEEAPTPITPEMAEEYGQNVEELNHVLADVEFLKNIGKAKGNDSMMPEGASFDELMARNEERRRSGRWNRQG